MNFFAKDAYGGERVKARNKPIIYLDPGNVLP